MSSASENLLGMTLKGNRKKNEWLVVEKLRSTEDASLGYNSTAYFVRNQHGREAFMKASDIGMLTRRGIGTLEAMHNALSSFRFEKQILEYCNGNKMDRVVTAIDDGDVEIVSNNVRDHVFYLIFEKAKGDLRKHIRKNEAMNLLWSVTALHNFFVAANQLHKALVAHNDIKPANAIVFSNELQKIADLGRATSDNHPSLHDGYLCAGDKRFAPPEQLYPLDLNCSELPMATRRVAGDLYNLASLSHFVLVGRSLTSEIIPNLRAEQRPKCLVGGSRESFQAALPYWKDTFSRVIDRLPEDARLTFGPGVDDEIAKLVEMVAQLGEPDPLLRGHPKNRSVTKNQYDLDQYISMLNATKSRLKVKSAT